MILWNDLIKPIPIKMEKETTVSEALCEMLASGSEIVFVYEGEDLIGYLELKDLILEKNQTNLIQYKTDMLKVPQHKPVEFYYNCSIFIGINKQNEITGYITKEEAISKRNEIKLSRMNESIDSAEIGIITMDKKFNVSFMNETAENIIGLTRAFLIGRNYLDLIHSVHNIEDVLTGRRLHNINTSFNFKKMSGHFSPVYRNGEINGIVHIFFLQQQLEEGAKELEFVKELNEDLEAIYSASNEQVLVVNPKGEITRLTGTFLSDFWGFDHKEVLLGKNVRELEEEGIFCPNIVSLCLKEKKKLSLVQKTDQDVKIWSTATPILNEEKEIKKVIVISRDVTSFHQLQEEIAGVSQITGDPSLADDIEQPEKPLIYRSKVMSELVNEIKNIAHFDSTVLLSGESGAGKEVIAHHIHLHSQRNNAPFQSINCGAIPENLLESELFGYEKGAFTGASTAKKGLLEFANKGTLLLDEISELPLHMQVKLLRALQEREIVRVGGWKRIKIDVRIIATTNRNMIELVKAKKFREDLYYRLNVIPIHIPALRERKGDIIPLALQFLSTINHDYQKEKSLSREALLTLESYHWPGNVRELQNIIERLAVTTGYNTIQQEDVFKALFQPIESNEPKVMVDEIIPLKDAIKELEDKLISMALQRYGKASEAAKVLQVSPATLSRKMNSNK
ncbi:sigma 54-interacting transcriptional regulator [Mesobacillus harenae]|uniref:sigma 54-interacting transcriptional regulator n=1 Tax=Mesobacillus harenae TaxID=2213203 RepID=UPI001580C428|nr:sigma 54-interacting transcriptional regulator [Mesobacillus harenae]